MNQAMAEFGEKNPGGDNFWWGEIHSVKGILTLAAMLEGRYSKELINQLANETYQILFNCSSIQSNERNRLHSPKMEELQKLLIEYDNIVNPFGNCNFKMKKPIEYFVCPGSESTSKFISPAEIISPSSTSISTRSPLPGNS